MVSMMWNGYLIYMKVKSRDTQRVANTESTGLSVSMFFERQDSFQMEAMLSTYLPYVVLTISSTIID